MTTKEIRLALKEQLGYNARKVSVSYDSCYGYTFTIRNAEVNKESVEKFASQFTKTRYCDHFCENVQVGNAEVDVTAEVINIWASEFYDVVKNHVKNLDAKDKYIAVEGVKGFVIGYDRNGYIECWDKFGKTTNYDNSDYCIKLISILMSEQKDVDYDALQAAKEEERQAWRKEEEEQRAKLEADQKAADKKMEGVVVVAIEDKNNTYSSAKFGGDKYGNLNELKESLNAYSFDEEISVTHLIQMNGEQYDHFTRNLISSYDFLIDVDCAVVANMETNEYFICHTNKQDFCYYAGIHITNKEKAKQEETQITEETLDTIIVQMQSPKEQALTALESRGINRKDTLTVGTDLVTYETIVKKVFSSCNHSTKNEMIEAFSLAPIEPINNMLIKMHQVL